MFDHDLSENGFGRVAEHQANLSKVEILIAIHYIARQNITGKCYTSKGN